MFSGNDLAFDAPGSDTREREEYHAEQFGNNPGREQATGTLKVRQDLIDYADVSAEGLDSGKAVPIDVNHDH